MEKDSLILFNKKSNKLYVFYLNRNQTNLDIYQYDLTTNKKRIVFNDKDPKWLNVQDTKNFFTLLENDNFIIASEKDGFRHLYLVEDNAISAITQGNYQVEDLNYIDEENKLIYFTATIESPLERHLYSVHFDGSNLKKITQDKGTHNISFGDLNNYYVDYYSNKERPTRVLMNTIEGKPYLN